ncbi:MAG: aldo/keto reductase, partial [Oscillospiraceae bacterium]|nr:aldo/keto reductase [Oscillospiraceae bacterium]
MIYRDIGKTGKKASVIGLGCEHLDRKPAEQVNETIRAALEGGVNYMDVFMPGKEVRENIAAALGSERKNVYLQGHIGSTDVRRQYDISRDMDTVRKYFEDFLRIFGYADFGMLFFVDSMKDYKAVFDGGLADYALKLKEKGDIGHIGFSAHNPITAAKVIETGLVDVMMFSVNLAFDLCPADVDVLDAMGEGDLAKTLSRPDPDRAALYALCERKGAGISVMKPLGA